MAYNNEYPYTDPNRYNADWMLNKIKEFEATLDSKEDETLKKANEYTDSALSSVRADFDTFKSEVQTLIQGLDDSYAEFVKEINNRLIVTEARFDALGKKVDDFLPIANEYTNQAIANNNEYIIQETTKALETVTVLNYFTGERISIQGMFDYLAQFHLVNGITYGALRDRNLTNQHIIELAVSNRDVIVNGGNLLV